MISQLAIYERTWCDCNQCRQFCQARPGCLAPSDIDHIMEECDVKEANLTSWSVEHFESTGDGPRAPHGKYVDGITPAIRPKVTEEGYCIFFKEGRCSIDRSKPFECKITRSCQPAEGGAAMKQLGIAISKSIDYVRTWNWLRQKAGK